MNIQIVECLKQSDSFGRILSQSLVVTITDDRTGIPDDQVVPPQHFSYQLAPAEFADDISAVVKAKVDEFVQAFQLLISPASTVNEAGQYSVQTVDQSGASTIARNTLVTPATLAKA